jgi:hypothetical protein
VPVSDEAPINVSATPASIQEEEPEIPVCEELFGFLQRLQRRTGKGKFRLSSKEEMIEFQARLDLPPPVEVTTERRQMEGVPEQHTESTQLSERESISVEAESVSDEEEEEAWANYWPPEPPEEEYEEEILTELEQESGSIRNQELDSNQCIEAESLGEGRWRGSTEERTVVQINPCSQGQTQCDNAEIRDPVTAPDT